MNQTSLSFQILELTDWASREAEEQVMNDLINTLLAEQFFDNADQELLSCEQWEEIVRAESLSSEFAANEEGADPARDESVIYRWWISRDSGCYVWFPVKASIVQSHRYVKFGGVYEVQLGVDGKCSQVNPLDPVDLMERVVAVCLEDSEKEQAGVKRFVQLIRETMQQTAWSMDSPSQEETLLALPQASLFQELERRASFRDRPFHPVSKAKVGLGKEEYHKYIAEFRQEIPLRWMAVKRQYIMLGSGIAIGGDTVNPANMLLSFKEREHVSDEMKNRGLSEEEYVAIPVHPWQMTAVLPEQLQPELEAGACVPLDVEAGIFQATSSVRSLAPNNGGNHYVKLPLGIFSLGASRYLPAVKLINGDRGESLLRQAKGRDSILQKRLFLCAETYWWAYMPENGSLFDDPPRHLSALVRIYPKELTSDPSVHFIPMSSLAARMPKTNSHFFDEWMQFRGLSASEQSVKDLFAEVCATFFEINLRLFRMGLLPEIHGQNSVLIWKEGHLDGMLLRDHDSVRLHLPWLTAQGIADPEYRIRPGYSNSLYNETPKELLFYLQTLGIQVNLYAMIEALTELYPIDESSLWSVLREKLEEAIVLTEFPEEVRKEMEDTLFVQKNWPLKLIVRPLLEQEGVPGAMPSGKGEVQNPFLNLNESGI